MELLNDDLNLAIYLYHVTCAVLLHFLWDFSLQLRLNTNPLQCSALLNDVTLVYSLNHGFSVL